MTPKILGKPVATNYRLPTLLFNRYLGCHATLSQINGCPYLNHTGRALRDIPEGLGSVIKNRLSAVFSAFCMRNPGNEVGNFYANFHPSSLPVYLFIYLFAILASLFTILILTLIVSIFLFFLEFRSFLSGYLPPNFFSFIRDLPVLFPCLRMLE